MEEVKTKKSRFELFHRLDQPWIYDTLDQIRDEHHPELCAAEIQLAWKLGSSVLGQCIKAPELWSKASKIDFVIVLNKNWWFGRADDKARAFIIGYELRHPRPELDKNGDQVTDDSGCLQWRVSRNGLPLLTEPAIQQALILRELQASGKGTGDEARSVLAFEDGKIVRRSR